MAATLGFRMVLFIIMTVSYFVFLVALVERFALLPPSNTLSATKANSSQSEVSVSVPEKSMFSPSSSSSHEKLAQIPYPLNSNALHKDVTLDADTIEICTNDEDCYSFSASITPKHSFTTPEQVVTRSGYMIRSVSSWAWGVLSRGIKPRKVIRSSSFKRTRRNRSAAFIVEESK